jgi:hypothetical protein
MITMRNDEKSSSNNTAISFIGFNEELVLPFIKKLSEYRVKHFVLVSSFLKPDKEKRIRSDNILIKAKEIIQTSFTDFSIEEVKFRDIWNFYEYLRFLSQFGDRSLYVNVSAGPSTFSSALTLFSALNGHHIFYNVEEGFNGKSFFVEADLTSLRYYFSLDSTDKAIISKVSIKNLTRKEIYRELLKLGKITERTVSYRIEDLVSKKLLVQSGKKPFYYTLPTSIKYIL